MTITVGGGGKVSINSIQSFQKFFVLLFVRIPPHEESHMQIYSESTGHWLHRAKCRLYSYNKACASWPESCKFTPFTAVDGIEIIPGVIFFQ